MRDSVTPTDAASGETPVVGDTPLRADRLVPLLYDELRELAERKLACERPGHSLQGAALVHEAYLRLAGPKCSPRLYRDRGHFVAAAAAAMRRVLVDSARRRSTRKRGGGADGAGRVPLEAMAAPEPDDQLLALGEALRRLAAAEPQKARLVELRYFAGLTGDEAAEALGISPTTADRHWAYARAWLAAEVRDDH